MDGEYTEQARQVIDSWPSHLRSSYQRIVDLIESVGLERLREPFCKRLEGEIWELRPSGQNVIGRALYVTRVGRRMVVVHAFIKKTEKTPRRELELARQRARTIL